MLLGPRSDAGFFASAFVMPRLWAVALKASPVSMKFILCPLAALVAAISISAHAQEKVLNEVVISASRLDDGSDTMLGASNIGEREIAAQRTGSSDSTQLLKDVPGVSVYSAGGISGLPAIHGLADDRIRVQVDGMELMPACPNHMNSVLSYIDPSTVAEITVYSGITPVSVGGDSIGGTIHVKSARPKFAGPEESIYATGQAGSFYRSNGDGAGYNLGANLVGNNFNLSYRESYSRSDNYKAGGVFKAEEKGSEIGKPIPGDIVGSSAYRGSRNREVGLALRHDQHLLQFGLSQQHVDFEGFPNQRMDMTYNRNTVFNLRYTGQFEWGEMLFRFSDQDTKHEMDMGPDRYNYGTGMPMLTTGRTRNGLLQANILHSERDTFRIGGEYQTYVLYDWWPAVGGQMGPNDFWNVDWGRRYKLDLFGEWEARWDTAWTTLLGLRSNNVMTDAAAVQGYDNSMAASWGNDAAAFNARDRKRVDHNWDFTALLRYSPDATRTFEGGYARKSRSPNLYQRYPWSTNAMADLMNNFVGDGNGYIGNPDLDPEVAHTLSASGTWNDADKLRWQFKTTAYYTHINDFIDARRCDFGSCSAENQTKTTGFVHLQYANQSARLYGIDLSGNLLLGRSDELGSFTAKGTVAYVRGDNLKTGDGLYNIMPLNGRFSLLHRLGGWSNTAELVLSGGKNHVSQVRNEVKTEAYELLNLRSSYEWKHARIDLGIENVFDRNYTLPLGGAYVGQGPSMTTNGIPWGVIVPGMGRSYNVAVNLNF